MTPEASDAALEAGLDQAAEALGATPEEITLLNALLAIAAIAGPIIVHLLHTRKGRPDGNAPAVPPTNGAAS